jgi:hypothetical protein
MSVEVAKESAGAGCSKKLRSSMMRLPAGEGYSSFVIRRQRQGGAER